MRRHQGRYPRETAFRRAPPGWEAAAGCPSAPIRNAAIAGSRRSFSTQRPRLRMPSPRRSRARNGRVFEEHGDQPLARRWQAGEGLAECQRGAPPGAPLHSAIPVSVPGPSRRPAHARKHAGVTRRPHRPGGIPRGVGGGQPARKRSSMRFNESGLRFLAGWPPPPSGNASGPCGPRSRKYAFGHELDVESIPDTETGIAEDEVLLAERHAGTPRGLHPPAATVPAADRHAPRRPARAVRRDRRQAGHPGRSIGPSRGRCVAKLAATGDRRA